MGRVCENVSAQCLNCNNYLKTRLGQMFKDRQWNASVALIWIVFQSICAGILDLSERDIALLAVFTCPTQPFSLNNDSRYTITSPWGRDMKYLMWVQSVKIWGVLCLGWTLPVFLPCSKIGYYNKMIFIHCPIYRKRSMSHSPTVMTHMHYHITRDRVIMELECSSYMN